MATVAMVERFVSRHRALFAEALRDVVAVAAVVLVDADSGGRGIGRLYGASVTTAADPARIWRERTRDWTSLDALVVGRELTGIAAFA